MPASYEVGAIFRIVDEASSVLMKIAGQLREMDGLATKAKEGLTALASTRFAGLSEKLAVVNKELSKLSTSATSSTNEIVAGMGRADAGVAKAASAIGASLKTVSTEATVAKDEIKAIGTTSFADLTGGLSRVGTELTRINTGAKEAATAMAALHTASGSAGGGGGPGGGGGGGGGGRINAGGGGGHGRAGLHMRAHGISIPGAHISMGSQSDGFMAMLATGAMFHIGKELFEAGAELEHYKSQALAAGMTPEQVNQGVNASYRNIARNPNASITEGMKNIIELNKATGSWDESIGLLPTFTTAQNAMQSVKADGLHQKFNSDNQTLNFARGLEELGVTQRGKTQEEREGNTKLYANELLRTMISTRGLFDGNALFAMTNNSGGAAQNWDMRMATVVAPIIGDIMKASKFGNADYMGLKSYAGGGITSKAVEALMKYGLTEEGDTYHDKKGWHLKANSKFAEGMSENIWNWSGKLLEKLKANGIDVDNQKAVNAIVNEIGSNKSTSMLLRALLEPGTRSQIEKEMNLRDKVSPDAATVLQKDDPNLAVSSFTTAWHNLMTALGDPSVDTAKAALTGMAKAINELANIAKVHPERVKLIEEALIGLAGAFAVLTAGALVTGLAMFLPGGIAAVGIAAVAGVLGTLAGFNWESISDFGKKLADTIKGWNDGVTKSITNFTQSVDAKVDQITAALGKIATAMGKVAQDLADEITKIPGKVMGAISSMASNIGSAISGALRSLVPGGSHAPAGTGEAGGGAFTPGAYHPGGGGSRSGQVAYYAPASKSYAQIEAHHTLTMDGRVVAQSVSRQLAALNTHPRQAPYSDPGQGYVSPDYGYATA